MFRAAFPDASDAEERAELQWVKDNYDLSGNNGSSRDTHITRLAGTWVDTRLATDLGQQYALGELIKIVAGAQPDPNGNYKRSAKSAAAAAGNQASPAANGVSQQTSTVSILANTGSATSLSNGPTQRNSPRAAANALPTPSPTRSQPNPPKRRREGSPALVEASSPVRTPLRRTVRRSPAPKAVSQLVNTVTPARTPKKRVEHPTPPSDKIVVVNEEGDKVEAVATNELHEQDLREQKKLIEDLKAQRAAAQKEQAEKADAENNEETEKTTEESASTMVASSSKKRLRDENEPEYKFEFKEPEASQREIASNRRVRFKMEPRTRSLVWGVAAFAMGMGAVLVFFF